jgi:hypothetical protein
VNPLWFVLPAVVLINLPFGWWRGGVRKFSFSWFVAVHAPVPLVAGVRILSGLGWHLATFPFFVAAYFLGQIAGARLRRRLRPVADTTRSPEGARPIAEG